MQSLLDEPIVENLCEKHPAYALRLSSFEMLHFQNDVAFNKFGLFTWSWRGAGATASHTHNPTSRNPLRQVETFNNMSGPQIPPGQTWFDTHKKSFQDVPVDPSDQGIATSEFLEAAESTTTLFGGLSSTLHWSFC